MSPARNSVTNLYYFALVYFEDKNIGRATLAKVISAAAKVPLNETLKYMADADKDRDHDRQEMIRREWIMKKEFYDLNPPQDKRNKEESRFLADRFSENSEKLDQALAIFAPEFPAEDARGALSHFSERTPLCTSEARLSGHAEWVPENRHSDISQQGVHFADRMQHYAYMLPVGFQPDNPAYPVHPPAANAPFNLIPNNPADGYYNWQQPYGYIPGARSMSRK